MSCNRFNEYLKERVGKKDFIEHIKICETCSRAYAKDVWIINEARSMNNHSAIPDLWPAIEEKILIQQKKPRIFHFRKYYILSAAAAAIVFIFAALWIFTPLRDNPVSDRILSQSALQKVKETESEYLKAIAELENVAYQKLDAKASLSSQLYRNKLALIDQQIRSCQEALENNPANSHIRRYLFAALQDKRKTLEAIIQQNSL